MTAVSGTAVADEELNYTLNGNGIERAGQNSWAVFAQDQWRFRPNITLNFGLRYELQGPYFAKNNAYTVPLSFENIFGCSGAFNFFKPGGCTNPITQLRRLEPGSEAYDTDTNNFAPNFGIAYSPDFKSGFMHRLFGDVSVPDLLQQLRASRATGRLSMSPIAPITPPINANGIVRATMSPFLTPAA